MKKICIITLLVAIVAGLGYAKKKAEGRAEFKETVWDFGTIKKGTSKTHEFVFTNTGDGNLSILSATADCGCTKVKAPEELIAPGKTGKITVTYGAVGMPQSFEKTITVRTKGKPSKLYLKIRGIVKP